MRLVNLALPLAGAAIASGISVNTTTFYRPLNKTFYRIFFSA
jgi:hypothetical protein